MLSGLLGGRCLFALNGKCIHLNSSHTETGSQSVYTTTSAAFRLISCDKLWVSVVHPTLIFSTASTCHVQIKLAVAQNVTWRRVNITAESMGKHTALWFTLEWQFLEVRTHLHNLVHW